MDAVTVEKTEARRTLVVREQTSWQEFPALWGVLLDEVWGCLRSNGITSGCRNIMLYKGDGRELHVEVGVETERSLPLSGRVVQSELPAGLIAKAVHRGSYAGLGETHQAALDFCRSKGLQQTGRRWERYGPHSDDPSQIWVEVCYLLNLP